MWMSFITSGVKMRLRPRTVLLVGAVSSAMGLPYKTSLRSDGSRLS